MTTGRSYRVRQPSQYSGFQCVGAACEDSCCSGLGVAIDKATYFKYASCADPTLQPIFARSLTVNQASSSDATFAFIAAPQGDCPFHDDDGLCRIQTALGEEALSRTCSVFPRAIARVDSVTERSLYLSCPEAARAVLSDPSPLQFEETSDDFEMRFGDFPETDTNASRGPGGKPYEILESVRGFAIELLQDRTHPLWERMSILGLYCERLDRLAAESADTVRFAEATASFRAHAADGGFAGSLAGVPNAPVFQRDFALKAIEGRVARAGLPDSFARCWRKLGPKLRSWTGEGPCTQPTQTDAPSACAWPRFECMIEQFLAVSCFRGQFPFGPQKSLYSGGIGIYDSFVILAAQYAILRSLGVALTSDAEASPTVAEMILVVQCFAKAFEHDVSYLREVRTSLADAGLDSIGAIAALVRTGGM